MLIDDIKKTIKDLKKLDTIESAARDAEKRVKNDNDFSAVVFAFTTSALKVSEASKQLGFKLSAETLQSIEEGIQKMEAVISSSVVDEVELTNTKQHINKKVISNLSKEWKDFYVKKTAGLSAKLSSMGGLVQDPYQIVAIRKNLNNGSDWSGLLLKDDGIHTRLDLLTEGIRGVDQLEHGLNLSEEIKDFVVKVTSGKAKVTDLTPDIIDWMVKENLTDKFTINFKNN